MGRDYQIRVSEKEKKLLDEARRTLHRSDSVPYGEVIAELARRRIKELNRDARLAYEGDTIADTQGF